MAVTRAMRRTQPCTGTVLQYVGLTERLGGGFGPATRSAANQATLRKTRDVSVEDAMIARIWHGWTSPENADTYESLLREEIFVGIKRRGISGFHDIQLLRRRVKDEVEFVTIMRFESLDAIREFAGADYEACVVPPKARAVLSRFDSRSQHYEIRIEAE